MTPQIFKVRRPDGQIWNIPEHNLDKAVELGGEVLTAPQSETIPNEETPSPSPQQKMFKVKRPDGQIWNIPESNLAKAQELGGKIVNEEDTYGKQVARTAKSLVSGAAGSLVDTPTSIYNIPAALSNATNELTNNDDFEVEPISGGVIQRTPGERPELPLIPSATRAISSSIDAATGGYTETPKGSESAQEAAETIGAVASPGGLAKGAAKLGAKGVEKVLSALGTTKVPGLAGAGAAGYASSETSQAGYGAAGSIGAGLAAGSVAGATTSALKNLNVKLALAKLTGNSPKNIDLDAVRAAEAAGLDSTNTLVNKSKALALAEQVVSKTPYFGTKEAKKLDKLDKAYAEAVEKSIDSVGKKMVESGSPLESGSMMKETFEGVKSVIKDEEGILYQKSDGLLPEGAAILPNHGIKAMDEVRKRIKTLKASPDEKFLLNYLDEVEASIYLGSGNGKVAVPVPIELLTGTNRSLNDIINWDVNASGVKKLLRVVKGGFLRDVEEYGKTNQDFYKAFKEANEFHGNYLGDKALGSDTVIKKIFAQQDPEKIIPSLNRISDFKNLSQALGRDKAGQQFFESIKREKLADLLMGKVIDDKGGAVIYSGFSKVMDNASNKELVKYLAGDRYTDLENFNKYAKAVIRKNRRNPNPSGTASTKTVINTLLATITGTTGVISGVAAGVQSAATAAVAGSALSWLINNKKPLQWGIEGAKKLAAGDAKQAATYSQRIERLMKEDLGEDFVRQLIALSRQEASEENKK